MDIISYALLKKNIRGLTYRGNYKEGGKYVKGDVVTQGTSIFYCNRDTSNPPSVNGEISKEWLQMLTVDGIEEDIDESFKEFDKMVTTLLDETKQKVDKILVDVTLSNERITDFLDNNIHKGKYDSSTKYIKGNEVEFEGSSYRALENVTGESPKESSKWVLVALRGVDGEGSVSSVNGMLPDEDGNVELGDISTDWSSLEGKPGVLDKLGESSNKLTYNGKTVGEELVVKHENKIASTSSLGHMRVGNTLKVDGSGRVDVDSSKFVTIPTFNAEVDLLSNKIDSTNKTAVNAQLKANEAFQRGTEVKQNFVDTFSSKVPEEPVSTEMSWGTLLTLMGEKLGGGTSELEQKKYLGAIFFYLIGVDLEHSVSGELYGGQDIQSIKEFVSKSLNSMSEKLSVTAFQADNLSTYAEAVPVGLMKKIPQTKEELEKETVDGMLSCVMQILLAPSGINRDVSIRNFKDNFSFLSPNVRSNILNHFAYEEGDNIISSPETTVMSTFVDNLVDMLLIADESGVKELRGKYGDDGAEFEQLDGSLSWESGTVDFGDVPFEDKEDFKVAVLVIEYRETDAADVTVILGEDLSFTGYPIMLPLDVHYRGSINTSSAYKLQTLSTVHGIFPIRYGHSLSRVKAYKLYIF